MAANKPVISAVGCYVPPGVLTNSDLEKMVQTNDEWITDRTGISERHIAAPDVATSDLATCAARAVLANRGIDTLSPLYPLAELGLARCYAQAGDRSDAITHYQAFLTTWKSADPDLPILKTARQELAQLR